MSITKKKPGNIAKTNETETTPPEVDDVTAEFENFQRETEAKLTKFEDLRDTLTKRIEADTEQLAKVNAAIKAIQKLSKPKVARKPGRKKRGEGVEVPGQEGSAAADEAEKEAHDFEPSIAEELGEEAAQ